MWNPNSDNKAKDVSVAETTNHFVDHDKTVVATSQAQQHSRSSNISGGNGNGKTTKTTTTTTLGSGAGGESKSNNFGHCATDKDKDNYTSSSISCGGGGGGIDSGFLSGPQLFEDSDDADEHLASSGKSGSKIIPPVQLNIVHNKHSKTTAATTEDYLDSGCIEEDFEDESFAASAEGHSRSRPAIITTAASPQQRGSGGSSSSEKILNHQQEEEQMILDSGVDSGVSEWFCKLTLRDPNQQVNNLGAVGSGQQTKSTSSSQKGTNNKDASDMASWEIYYQQNNEGDTQLHLACITGYVDVVAALIRMAPHPCLFNIQNDEAQTSLHLAVIYGQPKILRMLLIAGAEPTARDRHGNTPLHLACISGDTQCVKALTIPISASEINEAHRSYGHLSSDMTTSYLDCARLPADLEIRNYDGERCVHLAAQNGHIEILKHLVWFGADINAREGKLGRTPLHIAIQCCNEILANFLLEDCSTLNIETATYAGLTAYQVACVLDNPTMQNYLEKRGAETLTPPDSDYDSSDIETDLDDSQMFSRFGDPRYFANYNGGANPINVA